jgi:hypothetical protein
MSHGSIHVIAILQAYYISSYINNNNNEMSNLATLTCCSFSNLLKKVNMVFLATLALASAHLVATELHLSQFEAQQLNAKILSESIRRLAVHDGINSTQIANT